VLGDQTPGLRQRLADHRHGQRRAGHHTERGACQRIDTLGVQVRPIQTANERANVAQIPTNANHPAHAAAPANRRSKHLRNRAESWL